jgi:hypothetical protein
MRPESPQELTTTAGIVDVQEEVRAEVRLRTMAQNSRLNVVKIERVRVAQLCAEAIS